MSTEKATITHLTDLLAPAGTVTARAMFGEYGLYVDGKIFALVCDDTLFLKPLPEIAQFLPEAEMAPPYPGAKDHYAVTGDLDTPERVVAAVRLMAELLPAPKPKKPKVKRRS